MTNSLRVGMDRCAPTESTQLSTSSGPSEPFKADCCNGIAALRSWLQFRHALQTRVFQTKAAATHMHRYRNLSKRSGPLRPSRYFGGSVSLKLENFQDVCWSLSDSAIRPITPSSGVPLNAPTRVSLA